MASSNSGENWTGAEVWRGGVNTWECDEMGHMNVRFYVARAMEGLAGVAALLGMPDAFTPHAESTLVVTDHHLRFLREAHAGAALHMTAGVVSMGPTSAVILLIMFHSRTGAPAATIISRVDHARPRDARPFPWPKRALAAAEQLKVTIPDYAAPRSVSADKAAPLARIADGTARKLPNIARGVLMPGSTDVFGRMKAEEFMGRVSDGVPNLLAGVRDAVAAASPSAPARVGGAVLEYRLNYLDWARLGDHVSVHSTLSGFDEKTQRISHWMLDPITGEAWAFAEAVAVNFDLDARKVIPIEGAARDLLTTHLRTGFRFGDS